MMARGIANIVEIIVLAAGAHTFLRRRGALIGARLGPGEDILELHHAGIGKHQCWSVVWYERAGRHDLVIVRAKIF